MHWLCHNRAEHHPPVIIEYFSKQKKTKGVCHYPLWVSDYPKSIFLSFRKIGEEPSKQLAHLLPLNLHHVIPAKAGIQIKNISHHTNLPNFGSFLLSAAFSKLFAIFLFVFL